MSAERPINVAIKHPHRISVEHRHDLESFDWDVWLNFHDVDGSSLTVVLSERQVNALMGITSTDPAQMARDLYVRGHIDVDEFERRLDRASKG